MKELNIADLKEKRLDLIEEYYYWLSRTDCDDEILNDIELEIKEIENLIKIGQ